MDSTKTYIYYVSAYTYIPIVTGSLGFYFASQKPLWLAVLLLEFCSYPLGLFCPLSLVGCTWLRLPAWISLLPRVSQAWSSDVCVSEVVWDLALHTARHTNHGGLGSSGHWHRHRIRVKLQLDQMYNKWLLLQTPASGQRNMMVSKISEMPGSAES